MQYVLSKCWYLFTNLNGVTYRKTLANLISEDFALIQTSLTIIATICINIHYHQNHWLYTLRIVSSWPIDCFLMARM